MLVWLFMKNFLGRVGFDSILYKMLKSLTLFFLLPIMFVVFYITNEKTGMWKGKLFLWTPSMFLAIQIIFWSWLALTLLCFGCYLLKIWALNKRLKNAVPLDKEIAERYDNVCRKVGIKVGKIALVGLDNEKTPFSVGVIHPKIVLPLLDYSEEELDVIFTHELTHFLHKDILYKHFLQIVWCLNFFNPLVWILRKQSDIWCEYACDDEAWRTYGSAKEYAITLGQICQKCAQTEELAEGIASEGLQAGIVAEKGSIVDRAKRMKRLSSRKVEAKWMAALVAVAILVLGTAGSTTILAAAADQYVDLYEATHEEVEETIVEYVEYTGDVSDWEGKNIIEGEVASVYAQGSLMRFSWNVPVNTLMKTPSLYCKAGQYIDAQAIFTPANQQVRLGIIEPDGRTRFLQGESSFSHSFELTKTGYYYVFVENINDNNAISATGQYRWRD